VSEFVDDVIVGGDVESSDKKKWKGDVPNVKQMTMMTYFLSPSLFAVMENVTNKEGEVVVERRAGQYYVRHLNVIIRKYYMLIRIVLIYKNPSALQLIFHHKVQRGALPSSVYIFCLLWC
jgi:hypothetical protein